MRKLTLLHSKYLVWFLVWVSKTLRFMQNDLETLDHRRGSLSSKLIGVGISVKISQSACDLDRCPSRHSHILKHNNRQHAWLPAFYMHRVGKITLGFKTFTLKITIWQADLCRHQRYRWFWGGNYSKTQHKAFHAWVSNRVYKWELNYTDSCFIWCGRFRPSVYQLNRDKGAWWIESLGCSRYNLSVLSEGLIESDWYYRI